MHALMQTLAAVLPREGRLPDALRVGIVPPSDAELDAWKALPAGAAEIVAAGSRPADEAAADEFYLRTWAEPSVDVHGIQGGSPVLQKTVIAVEAEANVSIRLVGRPGSRSDRARLRGVAPRGRTRGRRGRGQPVVVGTSRADPPGRPRGDPRPERLHEVLGVRPLLIRSGGAIPLVSELAARGVATVLTGFALNESNIHSPNERIPSRLPAARDHDRRRPLPPPRRAWVARRSRLLWRPSCQTESSSAFSATSASTRRRSRTPTTYPSTAKQLDLSRLLVAELEEIGLDGRRADRARLRVRDARLAARARP